MRKRYQVFVSSTYEDLKLERQAAVEAILKAGHIPAGMELFTAGDQSQYEVIRRWIEESDLFMLILGARYGSIEPSSGLSYVEAEFNYARELGKPFFSVVLSDEGKEAKVQGLGTVALEQANEAAYRAFRERVKSQLCAFFATPQEVKLAVFETLPRMAESRELIGWVSTKDAQTDPNVAQELARLSKENEELRAERARLEKKIHQLDTGPGSFNELYTTLYKEEIRLPPEIAGGKEITTSLLELTLNYAAELASGVSNAAIAGKVECFLFHSVASKLAVYGLVEHAKTPASVQWQRLRLSKEGIRFLTQVKIQLGKATLQSSTSPDARAQGQKPQPTGEAPKKDSKGRPKLRSARGRSSASTTG